MTFNQGIIRFAVGFAIVVAIALVIITCQPKKRDVFLIVVDTMRADKMHLLPALDGGTHFDYALSTSSWTFPAMVSMMTGDYPGRYQIEGETSALEDGAVTLAETMHRFGYATCMITNNILTSSDNNFAQGYETVYQYDRERALETFWRARQWLEERGDSNEPVFMTLHLMDPHLPYQPLKPEAVALCKETKYTGRFGYKFGSEVINRFRDGEEKFTEKELAHIEGLYDANIEYMGLHMAWFLDYVKAEYPDALIIFTSDHGEEFMEHGGLDHGSSMYDELLHIPLVIDGPGFHDEHIATPVSLIDIRPTILAWCGIPENTYRPEGANWIPYEPPGVDLGIARPVMRGDVPEPRWLYHESTLYGPDLAAVTALGHRFIMETDNYDVIELYHVESDRTMETDKISYEVNLVDRFRADLIKFLQRGDDWQHHFTLDDPQYEKELRTLGYLGGTGS